MISYRVNRPMVGAWLLVSMSLIGCDGAKPSASPSPTTQKAPASVHAHAEEGPHHGALVELGNEDYHAEVVHGAQGEVTIYILDREAKNPVPIDAGEVVINLSHDGKAVQFKLPALAEDSDPPGKSSRFQLKDEELSQDLDAAGTAAKLVVSIEGKPYSGKIEHRHGKDDAHGPKSK